MTKKSTKNQKKALIIAVVAVILLLGSGAILTLSLTKKTTVAFYNIPQQDQANIQKVLGEDFTYRTLDTDKPLAWLLQQKANPDMIITTTGKAMEASEDAAGKISVGTGILQDMTSSIRGLVQQSNREVKAIPLLTSHLEVAVNTAELKKTGVKTINSWGDFERFAKAASEKNGTKLLFAGKDSGLFLDILGALAESINGKQQYKNAAELIAIALDRADAKKERFNAASLAKTLAGNPDAPLYDTLRMLNRWYKEGIIFSEALSIDQKSVAALMENGVASAVIMPLNSHREVAHNVIEKYASIYFPSNIPAYARAFTAPVYVAVPLKNKKDLIASAKQLTTTSKQEQLSRATGLAPVLARCRTPDKQADDVRYWVAATNEPLAGLSRDITLTHSQQDLLAGELAALIRFGDF